MYHCAACEDPTQGVPYVQEADYVARDNVPKYWALCGDHYLRADDQLRLHYAELQKPSAPLPSTPQKAE